MLTDQEREDIAALYKRGKKVSTIFVIIIGVVLITMFVFVLVTGKWKDDAEFTLYDTIYLIIMMVIAIGGSISTLVAYNKFFKPMFAIIVEGAEREIKSKALEIFPDTKYLSYALTIDPDNQDGLILWLNEREVANFEFPKGVIGKPSLDSNAQETVNTNFNLFVNHIYYTILNNTVEQNKYMDISVTSCDYFGKPKKQVIVKENYNVNYKALKKFKAYKFKVEVDDCD